MATILIVDDYADIRACLRTMLEDADISSSKRAPAKRHSMPGTSNPPRSRDYRPLDARDVRCRINSRLRPAAAGSEGHLNVSRSDPRPTGPPDQSRAWPFLQKPFGFRALRQVIDSLLSGSARRHQPSSSVKRLPRPLRPQTAEFVPRSGFHPHHPPRSSMGCTRP